MVNLDAQQILTREGITIQVCSYLQYNIVEPEKVLFRIDDFENVLKGKGLCTMKEVISTLSLNQVLHDRNKVKRIVQEELEEASRMLGVNIQRLEIDRIDIPQSLERAMASEKLAKLDGESKILLAKASLESATLTSEAAQIFTGNPISLQIEYIETLKYLSTEKNTTLIMPDSILGNGFKISDRNL